MTMYIHTYLKGTSNSLCLSLSTLHPLAQDDKLLLSYLRGVIVELALNFAPSDCLVASLEELKRDRRWHTPLLGLLQDLSAHSSFPVRRYTATLLGVGVAYRLRTMTSL